MSTSSTQWQASSLMQIAAFQLRKCLLSQQYSTNDIQWLPPNLKDRMRRLILLQGHAAVVQKYLPALMHNKVHQLDLSDVELSSIHFLKADAADGLTRLQLKRSLAKLTTNHDLLEALANMKYLEALHLQYNDSVIDDGVVMTIAKHCLNLREVDLSHCSRITDVGLSQLSSLKHLTCLNLSYTKVSDVGIEKLFGNNNHWTINELRLDNCSKITDVAVEMVLETCQEHLNIFIVHSCPLTTERSLTALQKFWCQRKTNAVKQVTWTTY